MYFLQDKDNYIVDFCTIWNLGLLILIDVSSLTKEQGNKLEGLFWVQYNFILTSYSILFLKKKKKKIQVTLVIY